MTFSQPNAEIYAPDGAEKSVALSRVTHLVVGAHQDDVEFMGFPLIRDCFHSSTPSFGAIVLTNGAGSPRNGVYADCTDEGMQEIRRAEQRRAADTGHYAVAVQLQFPSKTVRSHDDSTPTDELAALFATMRPQVVMTHQLADKHDSHIATALRVIAALRRLPPESRPSRLLGGEIWRGLDWLPDHEKVRLDAGGDDALAAALMGVFDSQIAGGKRYDLATFGRWRTNATFGDPYAVDTIEQVALAMDMTPLLLDNVQDPSDFILGRIGRFAEEIRASLCRAAGSTSPPPHRPS